jgi:hypothetical protein
MHFSQISVSDLILVNEDGDVVIGDEPVHITLSSTPMRGSPLISVLVFTSTD